MTTYNIDNFRNIPDNDMMINLIDRPNGGDTNTAARLEYMPDGKSKPEVFSIGLPGVDVSHIITDKFGDHLMFAMWTDDNRFLPKIRDFAQWVKDIYKKKLFADKKLAVRMGHDSTMMTPIKGKGMEEINLLHRDEERKGWFMFLRPTITSGVSSTGKKFSATTVLHRKKNQLLNIANMRTISGKGILSKYAIEISGKTGMKRFKVFPYSLIYDSISGKTDQGLEKAIADADEIMPLDSLHIDDEEEDLIAMAAGDPSDETQDQNFVVGGESQSSDMPEGVSAAPSPSAPMITAAPPKSVSVPAKSAGVQSVRR